MAGDVAQQPVDAQSGTDEAKPQADPEHRRIGHRQQCPVFAATVGAGEGPAAQASAHNHRQAPHQPNFERLRRGHDYGLDLVNPPHRKVVLLAFPVPKDNEAAGHASENRGL